MNLPIWEQLEPEMQVGEGVREKMLKMRTESRLDRHDQANNWRKNFVSLGYLIWDNMCPYFNLIRYHKTFSLLLQTIYVIGASRLHTVRREVRLYFS